MDLHVAGTVGRLALGKCVLRRAAPRLAYDKGDGSGMGLEIALDVVICVANPAGYQMELTLTSGKLHQTLGNPLVTRGKTKPTHGGTSTYKNRVIGKPLAKNQGSD
jgi:hypothetical protein